MPLITCLDCNREVSDRATACPNCGGPILPSSRDAIPLVIHDDAPLDIRRKIVSAPKLIEQASKAKEAALMAVAAVALVIALGIATDAISWSMPAEATGYAIGSAIVLLVIPYVVLFFSRPSAAWKTLIVMCVLLVVGQWSNYSDNRDPGERQAMLELAETSRNALADQRRLLEKYSQESEPAQSNAPPSATEALGESGDAPTGISSSKEAVVMQRLNKLIRAMSAESTALSEAAADAVDNLKLEETLSASELTTAEGISRGREKLAKFANLLNDFEGVSKNFADKVELDFRAIAQGSRNADALLSGFQKGRRERGEFERLIAANQRSLISTATRILDFMEVRLGDTIIEGDQILFPLASEAETYNDLLAELTAYAEEETVLTNRLKELIDRGVKSMDELALSSK